MKARLLLSICPIAQLERQQAIVRWTGMADNVDLVSVTRPAYGVDKWLFIRVAQTLERQRYA